MKKHFVKYYSFLPLMIFCAFYIFKAYHSVIHDYVNYFFGALFLKEGIFTTNIYFPYYFNKTIADFGYQNIFVSYAPNTPFLSIIFYPFLLFKIVLSKLVFNITSTILFIFSIIRLSKQYKIKSVYILLLPIVFFIPIKNNLLFGQVYFILFFFLSEGFLAYQKKQFKSMAVFWSFAIFLKVFPIILAVYLLIKKDYKALRYLVITCVVLLSISISINGFEVWKYYFSEVLPRASNGEIAGEFVDNYQSIFMFLKRLFVFDTLYNKNVLLNQPQLFKSVLIFIKILLIGIGFSFTKRINNELFSFSFWILLSILISPYGSTYTFILLIFLYFHSANSYNIKIRTILIILIFFIANSTLIMRFNFSLNYIRLLFLFILTAVIVWHKQSSVQFFKITFIALMFFIVQFFIPFNKSKSTKLGTYKTPILIYDYQIKQHTLFYKYWNEKGSQIDKVNIDINVIDSINLKIIGNQIFYKNKQITNTSSNKQKPIKINNKIIYMSDLGRGIGFYDLKQISLNE